MKSKKIKKIIAALLSLVMALTMGIGTSSVAFAADGDAYLALGSDLSESEKSTVLNFFGLSSTDGYNVLYVTNAEEHQYLDGYVDSNQIGSKALSSVMIREGSGSGINVTTYNIGYCTSSMYQNALETAGVENADVVVAGPFTISGTAALVGIIKAYEEMTGENVSDEVVEGAVDELITTGELGDEIGDMDTAAAIVDEVKEEMANNPNMSLEEIEQAIRDAASKYGVTLSDATIQKMLDMLDNLKGLDIDWGSLVDLDKAKGLWDRFIAWISSLL